MQNNAEQNANWVQMMMMPYLDGSFGQTKLGGQLATSWPWHVVLLEEFIFEFGDLFARECGAIPTDTGIVLLGCVQWWAAAICKDFQEKNNKIRWLVMRQRQNCNVEVQSSWDRGQQSHKKKKKKKYPPSPCDEILLFVPKLVYADGTRSHCKSTHTLSVNDFSKSYVFTNLCDKNKQTKTIQFCSHSNVF